jgi:hypothetical protein
VPASFHRFAPQARKARSIPRTRLGPLARPATDPRGPSGTTTLRRDSRCACAHAPPGALCAGTVWCDLGRDCAHLASHCAVRFEPGAETQKFRMVYLYGMSALNHQAKVRDLILTTQIAPPWVGSRSPDGWDQIPRWAGGWACTSHPGVLGSIPKREEPGKTGAPCIKVPGSSRVPPPRAQLCIRYCSNKHTQIQFKTHTHIQDRSDQPHPRLSKCSHTSLARSLSRSPSSPPPSFTEYPSPPRSLVRDGQTSPHRPRIVVSRSTFPPLSPPLREQLGNRYCSNKHTHRCLMMMSFNLFFQKQK